MKDIPEYKGKYAIDKEGKVFSHVRKAFMKARKGGKNYNYDVVMLYKNGKGKVERIHRLVAICYIENPLNLPFVDHINRDTKDNRVENLRWCNATQNSWNQRKRKGCLSKYKGVSWSPTYKKWLSSAYLYGKIVMLGYYSSQIQAAKTYNKFAKENFGEFAMINDI